MKHKNIFREGKVYEGMSNILRSYDFLPDEKLLLLTMLDNDEDVWLFYKADLMRRTGMKRWRFDRAWNGICIKGYGYSETATINLKATWFAQVADFPKWRNSPKTKKPIPATGTIFEPADTVSSPEPKGLQNAKDVDYKEVDEDYES